MRAKAVANANIALIKYWGKREATLKLPDVGSISITLDDLETITEVSFDASLTEDRFVLNHDAQPHETARVTGYLDLIRSMAGIETRALVESENNFPTGAGLASSASGFAALAMAASHAAGLELSPEELSVLARRGSASAARSLFGGFVEMRRGQLDDGSDAHALPILDQSAWPLGVAVAITSRVRKAIGSTDAMEQSALTSPFYGPWVSNQETDLEAMRRAIGQRDFEKMADLSEFSCLKMHGLMLSTNPGLVYWNGTTVDCIHAVRELRAGGVPVFFTIDAGPQVKAVCLPDARDQVTRTLRDVTGVHDVIETGLGQGAKLIGDAS
tara:strand:+ start:226 stop:1209 length:984 start_codon:yes stop_codon:yes gene_type:complete